MTPLRPAFSRFILLLLILAAVPAQAEESYRFREGSYKKGELRYINGLPVLIVQGTPAEIGEQEAALTIDVAKDVIAYPKEVLRLIGHEEWWPKFVKMGQSLLPQFPEDHLEELDAFAKKSGIDRDLLIGINSMVDSYRGGFACSSLIVDPERSATGGPLFGRNLDFFTLGKLQRYSLVVIYRPENKHAFVSVGFPGMIGCFSGMNDAGLAVAVHEVFFSRDAAGIFDPKGTPYTLCFRRILEECTTVEEAEALLRSMTRTTLLNLAVCDRRRGAVLEMTPKNVVLRPSEDGICACTNHFRTDTLATFAISRRYRTLMRSKDLKEIGLAEVAEKLHQVNLGRLTLQTMIFQPDKLELHLAIGSCPASALPLRRLELAPLFKTAPRSKAAGKLDRR